MLHLILLFWAVVIGLSIVEFRSEERKWKEQNDPARYQWNEWRRTHGGH